ncbi:MAG: sulfotransferase [Rhizomicrobium sp.]
MPPSSGITAATLLERAQARADAGQYAAALADLEAAHTLSPGDASVALARAQCLGALGRFTPSADAARKAIALSPDLADAHCALGFALEQLGELEQARAAYETALRLDTGLAEAAARLSALAARRADWPQTRLLAERALALAPGHAAARTALIMADMGQGRVAEAEASARALAGDPAYLPQVRAAARTLLADALDRQDRAGEAFAAYSDANRTLRELHRDQFGRPGSPSGSATARRLLAEFESLGEPARAEPGTEPDRPHVFILGFPRSGTTLLAEILAGHPGARVMDERNLLGDALAQFTARPGGLTPLMKAGPSSLADLRARYWERAAQAGAGAGLVIDKSPFHSLHLPVIARLFPSAHILFALRDPRDAVFACFRRLFALNAFLYECLTLEGAAALYDAVMRLSALYRARLPLNLLEVRNEDVIAGPEDEVGRICHFLGIAPNPAMTDFAGRESRRGIASPQSASLAGGVSAASRGQWRRYAGEMAPVLPLLAPWVRRFGYEDAA